MVTATQNLPRLVAFGDSQLEGLQPSLRAALAEMFQVVSITAVRGTTTRVLVDSDKIRSIIAAQQPDAVLFVIGGNDTASPAYDDTLIEAVAFTEGLPTIWVGPAFSTNDSVNVRHAAVSAQQQAVLPQLGVTWLDSRAWTRTGHAGDGVHFTRDAYAEQAAAIAAALEARRGPSPVVIALGIGLGVAAVGAAAYAAHRALA